jgi:FtsX-like permease family
MRIVLTWLRLDSRRRWRSLTVLGLLVALATMTVLTAVAGARRGQTAGGRLWARTLPATIAVLPNQPGFGWARIRALPEVKALSTFAVTGFVIDGYPQAGQSNAFPPGDSQIMRTIERPVLFQGRLFDPRRADEVVVTPAFLAGYGKGVGDALTLHLASPRQVVHGYDPASDGRPAGPLVRVRIVGVIRSPWFSDSPGSTGGLVPSPALLTHYRADLLGRSSAINALVRLRGGAAAIPRFRGDLARLTGRSDIDVFNNYVDFGKSAQRIDAFEAASLLAFGLAALAAAVFLIGQAVARYISVTVADLQLLRAPGLRPRQAVAAAVAGPFLAAVGGTTLGVAGAIAASRWMPIGAASLLEPDPGFDADWLILGIGWAAVPLVVLAGSAAAAGTALAASRATLAPRRSALALAMARAGLPVPAVVGTRFALEPGRGRSAVPVRPALVGAIVGVLGVLAAFTFAAGVSDAAANPARFGQTNQLETFLGFNGQVLASAPGKAMAAVARDHDVIGVNDARIAAAYSGSTSITMYSYQPVGGKRLPVVLTAGRMPAAAGEVALAPTTAQQLGASVGARIPVIGGSVPRTARVTGIGFVPEGSHNGYASGGWVTPAGYNRIFRGAHYAFKFRIGEVALRPGTDVSSAARRLTGVAARAAGKHGPDFTPTPPPREVQEIRDVAVLPVALGGFLALLAAGAVGHALATAVRRRRHELAVLRALGMTRRQARMVIVTQASVLTLIGLAFGVPLGLAVGRGIWRVVADSTPLAYHPPLAVLALLLIAPAGLLAANLLAVWPGHRAAGLPSGQILRTE